MSSVDVILPCYRDGHFLRQSVESVLAQRDISVRVLIIDDASPDCTAGVATQLSGEDSRVTFVRHPHNKGHMVLGRSAWCAIAAGCQQYPKSEF